ncbi:uncharacterized protein LOC135482156 [Liolophura sinensis]|uniref:uncharacterized protein LOC135482156 n=1 Tax=Liolophura sinensis TaxID=3198878 RepID=UPI003159368B
MPGFGIDLVDLIYLALPSTKSCYSVHQVAEINPRNMDPRQTGQSSCDCLTFRMVGGCCENRHWHAVLKKSGTVTLLDLDRQKQRDIEIPFKKSQLLPSKALKRTELELISVIGVHDNVVVIQIFCQDGSHIVLCDFVRIQSLAVYKIPYLSQGRPCLYECLLSADKTHFVIKVCMRYAISFCVENCQSTVKLVKISPETKRCNVIVEFDDNIHAYTCISFSPLHRHSELILGTTARFHDQAPQPNMADTSTWQLIPYRPREQNFILNRYRLDKNNITLLISKTLTLIPDHEMEIRTSNEGMFLLVSVNQSNSSLLLACGYGERRVFVFLVDTLQQLALFSHVCLSWSCNLSRMLRCYGNLTDCLGSVCVLHQLLYKAGHLVQPPMLQEICRKVVVNQIWPEDIWSLPLPTSMKHFLMFLPKMD